MLVGEAMVDGGLLQKQEPQLVPHSWSQDSEERAPPGLSDPFVSITGVVKEEGRSIEGLQEEHFYCLYLFTHPITWV